MSKDSSDPHDPIPQPAEMIELEHAPEIKQTVLSPELGRRLAAIDIGTNSIRLVVAEVHGHRYRVLDDEKVQTRLGRRLHESGLLDQDAVDISLRSLRRMKEIAQGFQVQELRAIATCAVREATNGEEFRRRVRDEVGLKLRVISSEEEARLAFYSVQQAFDLTGKNLALADIGGGSTEIVLASGNLIDEIFATQLGAVRLTEMFGADALSDSQFQAMVDWIDDHLKETVRKTSFTPHILFGSGGTFTTLATMLRGAKVKGRDSLRTTQISRAEVRHLLERLRKSPPRERAKMPGLNPDRIDIITAGVCIVDRLMHRFKVNIAQIHFRGVRDGLLLKMIHRRGNGKRLTAADRDKAIDDFARAAGCDMIHDQHVADLAGQIYSQLIPHADLPRDGIVLLQTAARLRDVGYMVSYDGHHKHSYDLIHNSVLPGFTARQRSLIANVARYHRGARPKKKHENQRDFAKAERRMVAKMAAILRIAGGLDRSRMQLVQRVEVRFTPDEVLLLAHSERQPEVDLWDARRRIELFERVFKTAVRIEWTGTLLANEPIETPN